VHVGHLVSITFMSVDDRVGDVHVIECAAVCCSVLQCVAVRCSVLQSVVVAFL